MDTCVEEPWRQWWTLHGRWDFLTMMCESSLSWPAALSSPEDVSVKPTSCLQGLWWKRKAGRSRAELGLPQGGCLQLLIPEAQLLCCELHVRPVTGQASPWLHTGSPMSPFMVILPGKRGRRREHSCFHEQLLGSNRERTRICDLRRLSAGKWKLFVSFVSSWQWLLETAVFGQTEIHSMVEDGTHLCGGAKQPHQFVPPIPTSAAMGLHLLGYWCQAGMSCPWRNPPVQMQVGTVCDSSWCAKATTGGHELAWKGRRDDLAGPCRCSLGKLSLHLRCFVGTVLYRPAQ